MPPFENIGRLFLMIGLVIAVVGLLIMVAGRVPWLGRLPGDILISRGNSTLWIPIVTSILLSIVLSLILTLIGWLGRR